MKTSAQSAFAGFYCYWLQTETDSDIDAYKADRQKQMQTALYVALGLQILNSDRLINACLEEKKSCNGKEI